MGYLDNSSITVDAILTKKGRELLAQGRNSFNITQFALADDEVDYDLWNPNDTRGTAYYGSIIEAMPLTEALPDETQVMKYKLITLPADAKTIPQLTNNKTSYIFQTNDQEFPIQPGVQGFLEANKTLGYTVTLADNSNLDLLVTTTSVSIASGSQARSIGDVNMTGGKTKSEVGLTFKLTRTTTVSIQPGLETRAQYTTISIVGNETGGNLVIPITVYY
jgi:hypothetical protein